MARTALITGASRNIGRTLAHRYAAAGYNVVVNSRDSEAVEAVARAIVADGGAALARAADVRDPSEVDGMIAAAEDRFGPVDILINNAVLRVHKPLAQTTQDDWRTVIDVVLTGAFNCIRAVAPGMEAARWGRIINFAGVAAQKGSPNRVAIVAAKAGIVGMSKGLASELAPAGITVNTVSPGLIDTDRQAFVKANPLSEQHYERETRDIPLGRLGSQDEIASLCLFLSSEDAGYITGQTLSVNGGLHMP